MDRGTAAALVTGAARFLDDLPLRGALHVKVLRSIHAHARILSIDAGPALRRPGVVAVYTGADLRVLCAPLPFPELGVEDLAGPARHALEPDEATFAGEPLAAVVAEGKREARDALDAIDVAFESLPPVTDPETAAASGSARARLSLAGNIAFRCHIEAGDPGSAFQKADRVVRAGMRLPRTIPAPIETRGVAAAYAPEDDTLTVWTTASAPHALREALSRILRRKEGSIRVIAPPARGGGPLGLSPSPEEALVAALALAHAPRPVRWMETRRENLLASGHARGQCGEGEAAFRSDGRLLAVRWRGFADLGAHLTVEGALAPFATAHLICGAYNVPAVEVSIAGVYTNKVPLTGGVAAGRAEAAFFIERLVDMGAAELELDPVELRRVNLPRSFPHVAATGLSFDSIECAAALDRLLEVANHGRLRAEVEARRTRGELVGIGLAAYIDLAGASASSPSLAPGWEAASVAVSAGASVEVEAGAPLFPGEGDALARIAVKELGVSTDRATVRGGDTARIPQGAGGTGSAPDADGAGAVRIAARKLASKLRRIAAAFLRVPEEYVDRGAESFSAGERWVTIEEVCRRAYTDPELPDGMEPGLVATALHARQGALFPFGAHLAVVSVDPETGEPRLERHVAVDDAGVAIHGPWMGAWAEGAIARAIGEALLEEAVHDEEGQLLSGTFLDYALPRARAIPPLVCSRMETPTRFHPLGARGGRESPGVGALPAIVNAAVDALRSLGVRHLDPPLRPERIWRILREQRGRP